MSEQESVDVNSRIELQDEFRRLERESGYPSRKQADHLLNTLKRFGEFGFADRLRGALMDAYTIGAMRERLGKHDN